MVGVAPNPRIARMEVRQSYPNPWKAELMKTCTAHPGWFCYSLWCAQCASWQLRKQALHGDLTRYTCCNGMCPCSGRMGEQSCPAFCLGMEVFLCFAQSVATTRWMIQDELRVQTTQCDNCIIGTMIFMQYLSCICDILACFIAELRDVAQFVDCLADFTWCTVCACMQTQHRVELNYRDANPHAIPPPLPGMQPPGVQMIATGQAPPPGYPPAGYPAQQPYPGQPGVYPAQPQPGMYR